jgi:ABC-2 type transport system ATP-binding protein
VNVEFLIEVVAELKAQHKTIIFSTHLMETAERLCDDIILINKSRKVLGGTLRDVKGKFQQKYDLAAKRRRKRRFGR